MQDQSLEAGLNRYRTWPNLVAMFFEQAQTQSDRPFLWHKNQGEYRPLSWAETARQVMLLANGLRAFGIAPGDRVALIAENRPEWLIADLGIMAAGAITVPSYTTYTPDDHYHLLSDSGAKAVVVSTAALFGKVLPAVERNAATELIITIDPAIPHGEGNSRVARWTEVIAAGAAAGGSLLARASETRRDDPACIIYTSGTGGAPKGVVLSHGAILFNCMGAFDLLYELGLDDEVFLSFLPLCHSYEHTAGHFFPTSIGAQIYYAESIEALGRNMTEARPTIMTAVPRLYETLHARIMHGQRNSSALRQRLFDAAVNLGRKRYEPAERLSPIERLADLALDRLVRAKVRDRFGGRIKALVSGGAPLNVEIGIFFTALGLRLLQGYGQTESAPVVSCNRPHKVKIHTVGPPLRDVEVRIADDGEILVRGELVMGGYWNRPEATAEVLRNGWLHTGDIGVIDNDGYLQITDRKKDIIVNSGGDNIAPQRVEGFLALQPEIGQAMVYGDKRPYLVALIVPDTEFAAAWARAHGQPVEALPDVPAFHKEISAAIERTSAQLSIVERVRKFIIVPQPFTVENNMMTPSLKIRRHVIRAAYRDRLEALY